MEQNANMPRGGEQNLFCQNIKKEIDTNDSYGENQDPIAITDQDRMANMRIRVKEEIDIKEEDLSEEETGRAELQHTSSGNDPHSRRSTSPLDNSISHRSQHAEKKISGHDNQNASELSVFQHKGNNSYEGSSEVPTENFPCSSDEKYACGSCDEKYSEICDLKNHIKLVHLGLSDYKCLECDKIFFQPYKLEKHRCYGSKIYECNVCNRRFLNSHILKLHSATHLEKKSVCDYCNEAFLEYSDLKNHINARHHKEGTGMTIRDLRSHENDKIYGCGICDERFALISQVREHIKMAHSGIGDHKCVLCTKRFPQACDLITHIWEMHQNLSNKNLSYKHENDKIYACGNCDERFALISLVQEHIKMAHSGIGDHKCVLCTKIFPQACDLITHIWEMHENPSNNNLSNKNLNNKRLSNKNLSCKRYKNKTFQCDVCNRLFSHPGNLKQHRQFTHKKYDCQVCNMQFSNRHDLKQHSLIHGERKYVCVKCSEIFIELSDLKNHMTVVHREQRSERNNEKLNNSSSGEKFDIQSKNENQNVQGNENLNIQSNEKKYSCTKCDERFSFIRDLRKHIGEVHFGLGEFKCALCGKIFPQPAKLINHECSKIYECQDCKRQFTHPGYLKQHSVIHAQTDDFASTENDETYLHLSKPKKRSLKYQCEVCNKFFSHPANLTRHSLVHKEKKFACDDCDKRFFVFSSLKSHIIALHSEVSSVITSKEFNNNDKIYACDNCDERYSWLADLKNHIKVGHFGKGRFKCALCSKTFSLSQYLRLRKHINLKHQILELNFRGKDKKYSCNDCDKGYSGFRDLKSHVEIVHLGMSDFRCEQCNKTFSRFSELKRHNKSNGHKNFKKFECDFCKKKFSHLSLLKFHIVVHDRREKFVCEICGKGFFIISMLKVHMNLSHIKRKDYQCEQCGKAFVQKHALEKHTDGVHNKIRDFECQFCYKRFQQPHHLRNHVVCVHERVKNFVCDFCGNRFLLAHHLRNHVNAVHQGIKCKVYPKLIWPGSPFF